MTAVPRHRVKFEKREGSFKVYDIKVIDSVDDEVQWVGTAMHQHRSRKWLIMREGSDAAMTIDATGIEDARAQLEKILDTTVSGK